MAHECIYCGSECYCHGDIDDVIVSHTPAGCDGCGCEEIFGNDDGDDDLYDDNDEEYCYDDFIPCSGCDGHPACEDFGCAIDAGLGHLVKPENPW